MASCEQVFEQEGEPLEVAANQPLHLDDAASVWFVKSGRIDLFATSFENGQISGGRHHLCSVDPGHVMFSTKRDGPTDVAQENDAPGVQRPGLVAVGTIGTKVLRLPEDRFRQLAAASDDAAQVGKLVDKWIERLTAGATRGSMPKITTSLQANEDTELKSGALVSPPRTMWIFSENASCQFLDQASISLGPGGECFPLTGAGWLRIATATTIRAVETAESLGDPRLWTGLERFHDSIVECALANVDEFAKRERARLGEKKRTEMKQSAAAMSQLAAAIQPKRTLDSSVESGADPLLAACRLVGSQLKVAIQPPDDYDQLKLDDPVNAIARASGVRIRRVKLVGEWWRDDNGPLLGFLRDGNHPVALIPSSRGYDAVDPRNIDQPIAADSLSNDLAPFAYAIYRSFAARLTPSDILRFSVFGTRRDWVFVIFLGLTAAVLGLFVPIATGLIISNVIPGADRHQLLLLVAALTTNAIAVALFAYVQEIAILRIETRMDSSVEAGVWDRLLNLPASFFRQYSTGDLAMRALGIGYIRQVLTEAAMSSLLTFVFSFVTFGLLFYFDVRLALLGTLFFLIVIAATVATAFIQLPIERLRYQVRGEVAGIVLQILTGISRLRVAGAEPRALSYWARHYARQVRLAYQSQMVSNNLATLFSSIPVLATMALFITVALFPAGSLSLATFLAFSAAFTQVMQAAMSVGSTISSVIGVVPLYERSKPILDALPESVTAKGNPGLLTGHIEISHVSYRYNQDGPLALDDVSMEIRPGEFVAFVGPSGAGKSTILRLLLGFATPETGSIYFDNLDFTQLDRQAVRRQIGVVFQNSRLTSGDIFRNIIGSAPLTLDDAWEAARLSGLDEDIDQMPMGMHTVISEGESTLSGGQRQRLLIARAIVNRPKILLFDEATSALDNVTQAKVAKSLESFKATRIVIAHRLSTIMNADRIYVVSQGKIVQQGKYNELISVQGMFADLAKRQLI